MITSIKEALAAVSEQCFSASLTEAPPPKPDKYHAYDTAAKIGWVDRGDDTHVAEVGYGTYIIKPGKYRAGHNMVFFKPLGYQGPGTGIGIGDYGADTRPQRESRSVAQCKRDALVHHAKALVATGIQRVSGYVPGRHRFSNEGQSASAQFTEDEKRIALMKQVRAEHDQQRYPHGFQADISLPKPRSKYHYGGKVRRQLGRNFTLAKLAQQREPQLEREQRFQKHASELAAALPLKQPTAKPEQFQFESELQPRRQLTSPTGAFPKGLYHGPGSPARYVQAAEHHAKIAQQVSTRAKQGELFVAPERGAVLHDAAAKLADRAQRRLRVLAAHHAATGSGEEWADHYNKVADAFQARADYHRNGAQILRASAANSDDEASTDDATISKISQDLDKQALAARRQAAPAVELGDDKADLVAAQEFASRKHA